MTQRKNRCDHAELNRSSITYPEDYRCEDCGRFFKINLGAGKWH